MSKVVITLDVVYFKVLKNMHSAYCTDISGSNLSFIFHWPVTYTYTVHRKLH